VQRMLGKFSGLLSNLTASLFFGAGRPHLFAREMRLNVSVLSAPSCGLVNLRINVPSLNS
jgi:hypothetical protein